MLRKIKNYRIQNVQYHHTDEKWKAMLQVLFISGRKNEYLKFRLRFKEALILVLFIHVIFTLKKDVF